MKLHDNKILITGGAKGIGRGLTERFLHENNTLIVCGRDQESLQLLASEHPNVIVRQCDVANKDDRQELFDWVQREHPDLNVLINNAGIQQWMTLTDDNFLSRTQNEISINIEGPVHFSALFSEMNAMQTIINVTSALAFVPLAKVPTYSASKAYLHSFTQSLRALLAKKNIEVIEIIPPAINTDLGGKGLHDHAPPVSDFVAAVFEQLKAGKEEITFGYSENFFNLAQPQQKQAFERLNGLTA